MLPTRHAFKNIVMCIFSLYLLIFNFKKVNFYIMSSKTQCVNYVVTTWNWKSQVVACIPVESRDKDLDY